MIGQFQLCRGLKKVAHDSITATATSEIQNSNGHNALLLYVDFEAGSGTFTVKIQGQMPDAPATFIDAYDNNGNQLALTSLTADKCQMMVGIPDVFKIVATEDADGATVSVAYELITV